MTSTSDTTPTTSTQDRPAKTGQRGRPRVYPRDPQTGQVIRPPGVEKQRYTARNTSKAVEVAKQATPPAPKRKAEVVSNSQAGPSRKRECRFREVSQNEAGPAPKDVEQIVEVPEEENRRSPTPEIILINANTIFLDTLDERYIKPCSDEFWAVMYSKEPKGQTPRDGPRWTTHRKHVREAASLMKKFKPQFCEWYENEWWPEEMRAQASENVQRMLNEAWGDRPPDYENMVAWKLELAVYENPFKL